MKIAALLPSSNDNWSEPSAEEFSQALTDAAGVMKEQKERRTITGGNIMGAFIDISDLNELVIISDLHGDFECLTKILEEIDAAKFLNEPTNKAVFLGDYVDRGRNSIGVLYALCCLKIDNPESTVLLRGNHEAPAEFPFSSHEYPYQISDRFGDGIGKPIYRKSLSLFRELAVAARIGSKLLLVHGGLPANEEAPAQYKVKFSKAPESYLSDSTLEEVLWNDPREVPGVQGWEPSRRGIGRHFGRAVTERWLEATGTACIVRGHEPCAGYRLDHDDKILTLFSSVEPYPSFKAAYLRIRCKDIKGIRDARSLLPFVRYPASP